jgi:hypothetical protein
MPRWVEGYRRRFCLVASNPTFGSMMNANEYIVLSVGPIGTMTHGAMQTVLVKVTPSKGDHRTFLWYVCRCMIDVYNHHAFYSTFPHNESSKLHQRNAEGRCNKNATLLVKDCG